MSIPSKIFYNQPIKKSELENFNINKPVDFYGTTVLMSASIKGNKSIIKLLLESGASKTQKDRYGKTAEDLARENGHEDIAQMIRNFEFTQTTLPSLPHPPQSNQCFSVQSNPCHSPESNPNNSYESNPNNSGESGSSIEYSVLNKPIQFSWNSKESLMKKRRWENIRRSYDEIEIKNDSDTESTMSIESTLINEEKNNEISYFIGDSVLRLFFAKLGFQMGKVCLSIEPETMKELVISAGSYFIDEYKNHGFEALKSTEKYLSANYHINNIFSDFIRLKGTTPEYDIESNRPRLNSSQLFEKANRILVSVGLESSIWFDINSLALILAFTDKFGSDKIPREMRRKQFERYGSTNNKLFEFLGDAVIDLVVTMMIYNLNTDIKLLKKNLVRNSTFEYLLEKKGLSEELIIRRSMIKVKTVANCFEALIGVLFTDGFQKNSYLILNHINDLLYHQFGYKKLIEDFMDAKDQEHFIIGNLGLKPIVRFEMENLEVKVTNDYLLEKSTYENHQINVSGPSTTNGNKITMTIRKSGPMSYCLARLNDSIFTASDTNIVRLIRSVFEKIISTQPETNEWYFWSNLSSVNEWVINKKFIDIDCKLYHNYLIRNQLIGMHVYF